MQGKRPPGRSLAFQTIPPPRSQVCYQTVAAALPEPLGWLRGGLLHRQKGVLCPLSLPSQKLAKPRPSCHPISARPHNMLRFDRCKLLQLRQPPLQRHGTQLYIQHCRKNFSNGRRSGPYQRSFQQTDALKELRLTLKQAKSLSMPTRITSSAPESQSPNQTPPISNHSGCRCQQPNVAQAKLHDTINPEPSCLTALNRTCNTLWSAHRGWC